MDDVTGALVGDGVDHLEVVVYSGVVHDRFGRVDVAVKERVVPVVIDAGRVDVAVGVAVHRGHRNTGAIRDCVVTVVGLRYSDWDRVGVVYGGVGGGGVVTLRGAAVGAEQIVAVVGVGAIDRGREWHVDRREHDIELSIVCPVGDLHTITGACFVDWGGKHTPNWGPFTGIKKKDES